MRSYSVKETRIGSAVSEILRYRHTDKHPVTFIIRISHFGKDTEIYSQVVEDLMTMDPFSPVQRPRLELIYHPMRQNLTLHLWVGYV